MSKIDRERCYICGGGNEEILERHHIVPRRHGGTDSTENLVDLCPSCHSALEKLYNKRFYDKLGVEKETTECAHFCGKEDCFADASVKVTGETVAYLCDTHNTCGRNRCHNDINAVIPIRHSDGYAFVCEECQICSHRGCESVNVDLVEFQKFGRPCNSLYCPYHSPSGTSVEYDRGGDE